MSSDLLEFLAARLAEDETTAHAAAGRARGMGIAFGEPVHWCNSGGNVYLDGGYGGGIAFGGYESIVGDEVADHIARFDPARVLADVAAKRQVLELHAIVHREIGWLASGEEEHAEIPVCGLCVPRHSHFQRHGDIPDGGCATVRILALPYAGHPAYQEAWRP